MQLAFAVFNDEAKRNSLFDETSSRDHCFNRFVVLRKLLSERGIACDTLDMCSNRPIDFLISTRIDVELNQILAVIKKNPGVRIIYMPTESPFIVFMHKTSILGRLPFDRVLYWHDEFVESYAHGVKCPIGQPRISPEDIPAMPFTERKFIAGIFSNKSSWSSQSSYKERIKAITYFSKQAEGFDLYGVGWDACSIPEVRASYRGACESKKDVLRRYKFSICYENTTHFVGSVDEKIFDCFASGVVPIYLGDPNIRSSIPADCYVDLRDFEDYEQLYRFLVSMSEDEFQSYLDAAKDFISGPACHPFTSERYAETVIEQIEQLVKLPKPRRTVFGFKKSLMRVMAAHPVYFMMRMKRIRRFMLYMIFVW